MSDSVPSKKLDVQPVMWLVFEYARILDGSDALVGEERAERVRKAHLKDAEIRDAIRSLVASSHEPPAEPDQAAMDRIFDSWFDSLREPPQNYHQIFAAGYAAGLLRAAQPPVPVPKFKVGDRVEWTNMLQNTFVGSIIEVKTDTRYVVQFDDRTVGQRAENDLRPVPTKPGEQP